MVSVYKTKWVTKKEKINIASKFWANLQPGVQMRCMHGHRIWKTGWKTSHKSTLYQSFKQTYTLEYRWDVCIVTVYDIWNKMSHKSTLHQNFELTYILEYRWDACMVTIYEAKWVTSQHCIKILSKLTGWSIDEMHAWSPYMKQNESQVNTASKFWANLQAGV